VNSNRITSLKFFSKLKWIDGKPLVIEPYRQRIFSEALDTYNPDGTRKYNLVLAGRAKKNWKTADLILAALYHLIVLGGECYVLAHDEDQAGDDLSLAKKLIKANPVLANAVRIKNKEIVRKDGRGFLRILPGQDVHGAHGKRFDFVGHDEIHTQRNWDLFEALQPDPTQPDAMTWITSYASIYHKPGVPLFDLFNAGKRGDDPRMFFSWYAVDFTTDLDFENASPEDRANPSRGSWADKNYLEQQKRRLPAHKYRRLHLNLPGLPEGSAYTAEMVMNAVDRGIHVRPPEQGIEYFAFVDMSGGSSDDATLAIAHRDADGRAILDRVANQGQRPPFDPHKAVERFVTILNEYKVFTVTGDAFAGHTFAADFESHDIGYQGSELTKSKLYEAMEAPLNGGKVVLLEDSDLEQQLLGLVWKGGKIDHNTGEHDDFANAVAGVVHTVLQGSSYSEKDLWMGGERAVHSDDLDVWITGPRGGLYW